MLVGVDPNIEVTLWSHHYKAIYSLAPLATWIPKAHILSQSQKMLNEWERQERSPLAGPNSKI